MPKKVVKDHLGNEFASVDERRRFWGISADVEFNRRRSGWDLKRILETPMNPRKKQCVDHKGNTFKSITDMLNFWNVPKTRYRRMISKGYSFEEIVMSGRDNTCYDHKGNKFDSKKARCGYYEIDENVFDQRIKSGWSLEKALTTPVKMQILYSDPIDGEKSSLNNMAKKYNIPKRTFIGRFQKYKSITIAIGISPMILNRSININKKIYRLFIEKRIKKGVNVFECYLEGDDGERHFKIMS